jgi:hypothetical protein
MICRAQLVPLLPAISGAAVVVRAGLDPVPALARVGLEDRVVRGDPAVPVVAD